VLSQARPEQPHPQALPPKVQASPHPQALPPQV
jgi:hypothetical protein